jgi:GR25 family glycosyltransferase involved in LPS biosynthesis
MNLTEVASPVAAFVFRTWRALTVCLPGGRLRAFGRGTDQIAAILVINLDRQPTRWRRVQKELRRFRTSDGPPLTSVVRRLPAVDARDGRAGAATADVDPMYRIGDQLYVQPDARLAASFGADEPVRMTRQEVAVARSHVEAWKAIASGGEEFVLVLEDDAWFKPGAKAAIDAGWREAVNRFAGKGGPNLVYLSYADAGGTALRTDTCGNLFRPVRGLWLLSGYVLSREGAASLLRAMPVVGPVDLWMNYRFAELGALALTSPAISQRHDALSDNAYSVMPYLARAGIVDGRHGVKPPDRAGLGPLLAWTRGADRESLAMALSMLGLRVRAFDANEAPLDGPGLTDALGTFDALVDPPLPQVALAALTANERTLILVEANARTPPGIDLDQLPASRSAILAPPGDLDFGSWEPMCGLLQVATPAEAFPTGARRELQVFRDGRRAAGRARPPWKGRNSGAMDESPWVLPSSCRWVPMPTENRMARDAVHVIVETPLTEPSSSFPGITEAFPGSLASFAPEHLEYGDQGTRIVVDVATGGLRPFRSGACASVRSFRYGRFQAQIRAAAGAGLITGFFLHRGSPRQEIDIEFAGSDPRRMLSNVFFNPGDDGAAMAFGYRGSPSWIDLGFDTTEDFHDYAIDWRPDRVAWIVDGKIVHERASWDPTPIPHLDMRVHANLWVPRSQELAGRINERALPASAGFRNLIVTD